MGTEFRAHLLWKIDPENVKTFVEKYGETIARSLERCLCEPLLFQITSIEQTNSTPDETTRNDIIIYSYLICTQSQLKLDDARRPTAEVVGSSPAAL